MEKWLNAVWYGRGRGGWLLRPLSWLYALFVGVRRMLYAARLLPSAKPPVPIIVVGNFTVGGTGKTPFVIWLAGELKAKGHRVGVVSRGYGRQGEAPRLVTDSSSALEVGDEPLLIFRRANCAVAVGRDRLVAARLVATQGVDVIIADDGLQHLALARDCELAMIDGTRGFGNGRLLPAGPLRESAARIRTVDAVILTEGLSETSIGGRPVFHMALTGQWIEPLVRDSGHAAIPITDLAGQKLHAVAGIANPDRFFRLLLSHGAEVIAHPFGDHHEFSPGDLSFGDDLPILMTEKDAVKCSAFASSRMGFVPVAGEIAADQARDLMALITRKAGL